MPGTESSTMKLPEQGIDDNFVTFTFLLSIGHGWGMTLPTKIDKTINLQDPYIKFFGVTTRAICSISFTDCSRNKVYCRLKLTTVKAAMVETVQDWKSTVTNKTTRLKTEPKLTRA